MVLTFYRAYDPQMGRWLSADPIGEAGGINLYVYVENNVSNFDDPLGLQMGGRFPPPIFRYPPRGAGPGSGPKPMQKCPPSAPYRFRDGKMHKFTDPVATLDLKGVRFPAGKKKLEELGLTHQINPDTGRHNFIDSQGRVRVAYDPKAQQHAPWKKEGHWHKYGHDKGKEYKLDNSGQTTDPKGTAAHIPCE
jgi:uncharacterized protein RhaS with RHS repeats